DDRRYTYPYPTRRSSDLLPGAGALAQGAEEGDDHGDDERQHPGEVAALEFVGGGQLGMALVDAHGADHGDRVGAGAAKAHQVEEDRKSTRLNSSHVSISY